MGIVMAISDWDISVDSGNLSVFIENTTPILDFGSLAFEHTGTSLYTHGNVIPNDDSLGLPHGIVPAGRLRTVCRVDEHDGSTIQISYFGVSTLQSQDDMVAGGSCYALLVASEEGFANPTLRLHKFTAGLTNSLPAPPLVAIPYPGTLTIGVPFTLELQWVVDVTTLGGTFLLGSTGVATDFSDLTGQLTIVDTMSPLTTSVAEGLVGSFKNNVGGDTKKVLFDNTTLYELV
jgi:hypothetical protein